MKAKDVSLKAIVLAIVWVMVLFLVKGFVPVIWAGKSFGLDAREIIISGVFFVVACSPLYRSIWLDKKLGISADKTETEETAEGVK
ncbi:hypothetical protein SAMN04487977_104289 [Treponema bryantii]|uniref:Uncharacterized protein n=1 Tax=Treponema bryantii TaxID=163 RepID=A0A1H9G5P8_9SPIR|nr:hypothetical protein [Treponema bryantii]SEQ45330.1 hypothetical protein SAMN04487977_104289 [Treponema bryantii]